MKKKVNIYVDGFNFYYGLKDMVKHKRDWRKFYWIDLVKLFEQFLLEDEELGTVHYFTARPKNKGKTADVSNPLTRNQRLLVKKVSFCIKMIYAK